MQIHHGKHHQTYVNNLNAAIEKAPELANKSLDDLMRGINERSGSSAHRRPQQRRRTLEPLDVLEVDGAKGRRADGCGRLMQLGIRSAVSTSSRSNGRLRERAIRVGLGVAA